MTVRGFRLERVFVRGFMIEVIVLRGFRAEDTDFRKIFGLRKRCLYDVE